MTETVTLPDGWDRNSRLPEDLGAVLMAADCPWLQAITETAFVVATILIAEEDVGWRVAVAETIAAKLLEAARTGRIPGEVVQ